MIVSVRRVADAAPTLMLYETLRDSRSNAGHDRDIIVDGKLQRLAYTAYVRFSNGAQLDDTKPDIRSISIKLTGVPGRKILDRPAEATTHDFILADNQVFFIRDTRDYLAFMRGFERTMPDPPTRFIAWLQQNRPSDLPALLKLRQQIQDSPLTPSYLSQVPYWFGAGDTTIRRYGVVPWPSNMTCWCRSHRSVATRYLQQAMIDQLTGDSTCTSARRS
jgi:hypothetical protein